MLLAGAAFLLAAAGLPTVSPSTPFNLTRTTRANSTYTSLASGNLSFSITPSTTNLITSNDDWSAVTSVEGYSGNGLTAVHGIDPQIVTDTEFAANTLPNTPTNVAANRNNPNAFNTGGVAEFDSGTYLAIGLQGNVQANPYLVFYVNTLGRTGVSISYQITDIDGGSNNAVSAVALQYRVGSTGPFINIPAGYIADATLGPNSSGLVTTRNVSLPPASFNQAQVQIRLITTNAAAPNGTSTPDEWIGVNNIIITASGTTSAEAEVRGRLATHKGTSIPNALVEFIDATGKRKSGRSNAFGYYRVPGLMAGQTYLVLISSKRFLFESTVITVYDSEEEHNFEASVR